MKRLLLLVFLCLTSGLSAQISSTYINESTVDIIQPPMFAPQIDATNFINNGVFSIDRSGSFPFQTWDTLNWTNNGIMTGSPGFQFNWFDSSGLTNGWSANFQNSVNATITGFPYVLVSATNIFNQGSMTVSGDGLMTLSGKNLDLTRGGLTVLGDPSGVQDLYWGMNEVGIDDFKTFYSSFNGVLTVKSPPMLVTMMPDYNTVDQVLTFVNGCGTSFVCTNGFTVYAVTNKVAIPGDTNINSLINILFLRQTNSAISNEVRFSTSISVDSPGATKYIKFVSSKTNLVTGVVSSSQLFFTDTYGNWATPPTLVQMPAAIFGGSTTFRPSNYDLSFVQPTGFSTSSKLNPSVLGVTAFVSPGLTTNIGWGATISGGQPFIPDPTIVGSTYSNVPGRLEITASGDKSFLDLSRTMISGESYLKLSATNHFVGSANAVIASPVSDFNLGSTNGMMVISNLTTAFIPQMDGTIKVWSGRWTNVVATGNAYYTVTMVDAALVGTTPPQVQNLSLRSTNLVIADVFNVFGSLLLDTVNLTIKTNIGNGITPSGELNLSSGEIVWSPSLPKLQNLTNFGKISTLNTIYFAGARTPPWFSGTFDEPYQSLVTHGPITSVACSIWANYLEVSGLINAGLGPISVQAGFAIITNGTFLATGNGASITNTCGSLLISNQVLRAGRSIILTETNLLDDGSLSNSVDTITGKNIWTVNGGMQLTRLPTNSSLLGTTITNTAGANSVVRNVWAGQDRGAVPGGFVNNAALGRLILDGRDSGSLFTFTGPSGDVSYALYVDLLELKNAMLTNVPSSVPGIQDFTGIDLAPNFTIYFAQAIAKGQSIAETLNGSYGYSDTSGGRFFWVSNYNVGFWSSTSVIYSDGTTNRLNTALLNSPDIDSNGNGIPNLYDTNPIPVLSPAGLALRVTLTNMPTPMTLLSWNAVPFTSNYLYVASSPLAPSKNWRLLTNFVTGNLVGSRLTAIDPETNTGSRYYRVRATAQ